jgi:hypothetical protein
MTIYEIIGYTSSGSGNLGSGIQINGGSISWGGEIYSQITSLGLTQSQATTWNSSITQATANGIMDNGWGGGAYHGFAYFVFDDTPAVNQKVDVYFYPDLNVSDIIVDQKVDVYFYPDNNVTDSVINQEVKIEFYPDGNVADETTVLQEVKIEFYPDGNVSDVVDPVVVDGFKFWFGMSGKKRYGKGLSKRISF